jgi:hypothetical protein
MNDKVGNLTRKIKTIKETKMKILELNTTSKIQLSIT